MATQYGNTPYYLYDTQTSPFQGQVIWAQYNAPLSAKFTWALDSDSNLYVAHKINGYPYTYYPYVSLAGKGSLFPQVQQLAGVKNAVSTGNAAYIKGCINSLTGELTLNAAGRTQMTICGLQLWMSNTLGSDVNRGGCVQMFPTIVPTS
jgi:hypothetical protein